jgi:hypothetical protein
LEGMGRINSDCGAFRLSHRAAKRPAATNKQIGTKMAASMIAIISMNCSMVPSGV